MTGSDDRRRPVARAIPDLVWAPLVTALLTLAPGLVGIATGRILLFPSLGPSAFLQANQPEHPSSRFYNVVVSHLVGLGAAFVAVSLFGIAYAPSVFEMKQLTGDRVAAATLAVALAALAEKLLRAPHPPAASTTLLAALGSFHPTVRDATSVAFGVLVVAVLGELFRRARARTPEEASL